MTSPRLRRREMGNAWVVKALLGFAFLVLTTSCAVSLTLKLVLRTNQPFESNRSLLEQDTAYPGAFIDLWPSDSDEEYRETFLDCIPGVDDGCQIKFQKAHDNNHDNPQDTVLRVALVHPPGLLGEVFVEYVRKVLNLKTEQKYPIELVPTTELIDSNHNYSIIIRLATLPPLLEACDTALKIQQNTKLTLDDLMDFVRSTIRFQCHITERATDTPLFTITLDRMAGFSTSTAKKLQKLLSITPNPDAKKNRVDMKDLPLIIMDRVSAASQLVQSLAPVPLVTSTLERVLEEELQASQSSCLPIPMLELYGSDKELMGEQR